MEQIKQTAVEWVLQYLDNVKPNEFCSIEKIKEVLEQAKAMEKEKIKKVWDDGVISATYGKPITFEQYYNDTYGGNNHLCCTPIGQIKRYVNCIGCDRKPLTYGGNK